MAAKVAPGVGGRIVSAVIKISVCLDSRKGDLARHLSDGRRSGVCSPAALALFAEAAPACLGTAGRPFTAPQDAVGFDSKQPHGSVRLAGQRRRRFQGPSISMGCETVPL